MKSDHTVVFVVASKEVHPLRSARFEFGDARGLPQLSPLTLRLTR